MAVDLNGPVGIEVDVSPKVYKLVRLVVRLARCLYAEFGGGLRCPLRAYIETGVPRVAGWLVSCLFLCVDVIDGAQQCSVLQAISGDIDGIIHRHSCCAGFECWFFSIIFLGSKTEGFGSKPAIIETEVLRVAGWLVGCLSFCVDVIDGAQQCSVLQAIIGDIDGIIHRHSCCARFECWFFSFFSCYVGCLPK